VVAPGNSIGTLTVTGNFRQTGGVYQVKANAQSQSDRIVAGGDATELLELVEEAFDKVSLTIERLFQRKRLLRRLILGMLATAPRALM